MRKKLFFLALLTFLMIDMAYAQCAMCKKVATDAGADSGDTSVGEQLNFGILYLLAIPYIIFFVMFRKKIRAFLKELRSAGR
jgi:hypothetical protein